MKVAFANTWFTPGGFRLKPGEHSIPDAWEKLIPKTATVTVPPKVKDEPVETPDPVEPVKPGKKK